MNARAQIENTELHADMPYVGATDIQARLKRLKSRLFAGEEALFAPAEIALRELELNPASPPHLACWFAIARWHYFNLEYEAAEESAVQAVTIARCIGKPLLLAKALKMLGLSLSDMGKPADAIPILLAALENAHAANNSAEIAGVLINLGVTQLYGARHGIAYECFDQALSVMPPFRASDRVCALINQGQLLLRIGEIARGLETAQRARSILKSPRTPYQVYLRLHLEVLQVQLRVAIGDIDHARQYVASALRWAPRAGETGRRFARLASLLVDAHNAAISDDAVEELLAEVRKNKPRFGLYRISLDFAVAALQVAGRPNEALQFLREAAQLDMSFRVGVISHALPMDIGGELSELDALANARANDHHSRLLTQAAHLGVAADGRIEHLVGLAIRSELREEDTFSSGEHVYRVARLAELLAREAGCSDEETVNARLAGLLHDVGKVFAPDQLLLKREALTDSEKALLRKHSEDGAGLIENLKNKALRVVADAVRHSHERWDGSGYPAGMQGEAIPIAARIVAICDSFDAMTHWRLFRSPRSFASALSEIEAGSGSRYDPRLSRLFVTLLRRLQRETDDLDRYLAEGAENSPVVQEQRRLAKLLRPQRETL
jgi:putative two-component system response regulator